MKKKRPTKSYRIKSHCCKRKCAMSVSEASPWVIPTHCQRERISGAISRWLIFCAECSMLKFVILISGAVYTPSEAIAVRLYGRFWDSCCSSCNKYPHKRLTFTKRGKNIQKLRKKCPMSCYNEEKLGREGDLDLDRRQHGIITDETGVNTQRQTCCAKTNTKKTW